jgi:hypothetical protein
LFDRSRSPRVNFIVIGCAFFFSAAHKFSSLAGDDRAWSFAARPIVVNHHSIFGLLYFMSVRGVGEKCAVMALASPSVQDRQPSFAAWVEAPWRDGKQPTRCGLFSTS